MNKTLIIYSTIDGQTLSICQKIKNILDGSAEVELVALSDFSAKYIQYYDVIILGASIRYGKHRPEVHKFVEAHRKVLEKKGPPFFPLMLWLESLIRIHRRQIHILKSFLRPLPGGQTI